MNLLLPVDVFGLLTVTQTCACNESSSLVRNCLDYSYSLLYFLCSLVVSCYADAVFLNSGLNYSSLAITFVYQTSGYTQ